ncbi:unnamed protein product [Schistosoma curassoni]|uniref:Uncharacterized protein n=1 Tax=Schistosoma curassoni TaxID=6186 RepID=A0A183K2J0_9TREM|nr:unnamed protein product [Schistosoma curassoni]
MLLQKLNTALLRHNDKLSDFKITLNNRFQAFQDLLKEDETIIEENWRDQKRNNFSVSEGFWPQEALS